MRRNSFSFLTSAHDPEPLSLLSHCLLYFCQFATCSFEAASQILARLSPPPVTIRWPSGEKAAEKSLSL